MTMLVGNVVSVELFTLFHTAVASPFGATAMAGAGGADGETTQ